MSGDSLNVAIRSCWQK